MIGPMVPEWVEILNNDPERKTMAPIHLAMENDSYYAVHSFVKSTMDGDELNDVYRKAFPMTRQPEADLKDCFKSTSLLLQQEKWPYCEKDQPCKRPNGWNRADLTLNYVEVLRNKPPEFTGYKLFSIPFLIMEVEGSKEKWGKLDQQAKAMREVLVSLTVMPECYLIFIYPAGIEIWKAERNHARCKIDVTAECIDWDDGVRSIYEAFRENPEHSCLCGRRPDANFGV